MKRPIELWDETKAEYLRWLALNPLQATESKPPAPRGELYLTVAVAVLWCIILVILVGNWTVPIDKILP